MAKTYSPKQVARSLGVSESTLKRWCDQGRIQTVRTVGGHRRIAMSAVMEFVRTGGCPLAHPELLDMPAMASHATNGLDSARDYFRESLVGGRVETCRQIVGELLRSGHSIAAICDCVMAKAMHDIGDLWACGTVDIYQERLACDICLRVLQECEQFLPPETPEQPLAIGGAPEHDVYSIPTRMVALTLREAGWRAISLGNMLPMDTILHAIERMHPSLVWLSVSNLDESALFVEKLHEFQQRLPARTHLIVGGRGLMGASRPRLADLTICESLQDLRTTIAQWGSIPGVEHLSELNTAP